MMKMLAAATLLTAGLALGGCPSSTNQTVGAGAGGLLGGLIGSQIGSGSTRLIATGIGAGVGVLLGQQIGAYLDERDKQLAEESTVDTYRSGTPRSWENPETGTKGTVRPVSQAQVAESGDSCQVQEQTIRLEDGRSETTRYKVCERDGEFYTQAI
ncbi:MAG TPA: glycine zipper 2TM domain-containing protein [Kiloniellales bacterium]|jgi:surface antigen|nr:glycine zipper 2TM domain-containing protein [Kiloniellales bacterium]